MTPVLGMNTAGCGKKLLRISEDFLQEMTRWHVPWRTLRSSSALLLEVRRCKCKTWYSVFGCAGPTLWNNLPLEISSAKDINCFKSLMKPWEMWTQFGC